ncbi:hypothetical protein CUJ83_06715 [Methanocella sp. CWC-04]|uniref:ABC transmembrane type-2 domain-containing protein n=1 Tax=Methanooceanicella nereidis TaxID=2052831 RepID=A0AAP2RBV0_9EURY|nr:ABC transporter permease [Methanocella sp. CWC-04]MCD1294691.1 hypothetical protein [Methanocella sp. CWC-04]
MDALRIISLAVRIVTQCVRDRRTMALIIIVPSLVMALLGYFFATDVTGDIVLGIVDEDQGMGGIKLSTMIADELRTYSNITVVSVDAADADRLIKDKEIDGAVFFSKDFTSDTMVSKKLDMDILTEGVDQARSMAISMSVHNATISTIAKVTQKGEEGLQVNVNSAVKYADGYSMLDLFAPYLLGLIAFFFVFMFTGVTFLRERSFGTFERLLVSPITRSEIILGYMLGFSVFAFIQSIIILLFAIFVLNVKIAGDVYSVIALQLLLTIVGVNLGILCSSFAKNELQAVQFIPLFIIPQVFLDGMFWPISTLPEYLQVFSYIMPLTYANDALQNIMVRGYSLGDVWLDIAVLIVMALVVVVLSTLSLNKQLQ